jgi:hypothetical protein
MAKQNKTKAAGACTLERELKAFESRKAGASYTRIGAALRISAQGAHKLVTAVFQRYESELTETVPGIRQIEL